MKFTPAKFFKQFEKLQPDRIHIRCPICEKLKSNQRRSSVDPIDAAVVFMACNSCYINGRKPEIEFYNKKLKRV